MHQTGGKYFPGEEFFQVRKSLQRVGFAGRTVGSLWVPESPVAVVRASPEDMTRLKTSLGLGTCVCVCEGKDKGGRRGKASETSAAWVFPLPLDQ